MDRFSEAGAVRVAYMFGYDRSSPDRTGWLRVTGSGYEVVDDREDATPFDPADARAKKEFFDREDELSGWRFHAVKYNIRNSDEEEVLRD